MKKLLFLVVAIVIVLSGMYRMLTGKTSPEIIEEIIENQEPDVAPSTTQQEQEASDKQIVTCGELAADILSVTLQEARPDATFPQPSPTSVYCGSTESPRSYYYLYDLEDQILMDYYREAFEGKECTTTGAQLASDNRMYKYALPFTCPFGRGIVASLRDINAYVVTFQ